MPDVFVQSFAHLTDKPRADRALHILQRVASLVKPIMRTHGWVLPVLSEFFPDNPNLLDVNMGQKILVRLRPPYSPDTFLPEEDVVQTMLHELTHNVHGPHDEKFYKYLSGLQDEYDALQRSGYAGEGFFTEGRRLGTSHNVPPHMARLKALEAAEKRRQTSRVLGPGGRLGGATKGSGLSPRELAARAAERRLKDEKSCASGADAQREIDRAAKDSIQRTFVDLTVDDDAHGSGSDSDIVIVQDVHPIPKRNSMTASVSAKTKNTSNNRVAANPSSSRNNVAGSSSKQALINSAKTTLVEKSRTSPAEPSKSLEWACMACTLLNPAHTLHCKACLLRKPLDECAGWSCLTCGEEAIPHEFWTCSFCGTVKLTS
ncbi:WLM-domain-containing protein [Pholiota conissans]|uniref:WLM-domain-containing protein n=1 Tax=Pholiota conissans TaxID=109636 RepID=A0A9P5ZFT9_9AGAR|nr:WLM-domain-containing protein [Pholiota conissans]